MGWQEINSLMCDSGWTCRWNAHACDGTDISFTKRQSCKNADHRRILRSIHMEMTPILMNHACFAYYTLVIRRKECPSPNKKSIVEQFS